MDKEGGKEQEEAPEVPHESKGEQDLGLKETEAEGEAETETEAHHDELQEGGADDDSTDTATMLDRKSASSSKRGERTLPTDPLAKVTRESVHDDLELGVCVCVCACVM